MAANLDPQVAKTAAVLLRKQQVEIHRLEKVASEKETRVAQLERFCECLKIAHQLSEIGRIPKDFVSIEKRAETLAASDKDLSVVKEALDMSMGAFDLGTVSSDAKPVSRNAEEAFAAALME